MNAQARLRKLNTFFSSVSNIIKSIFLTLPFNHIAVDTFAIKSAAFSLRASNPLTCVKFFENALALPPGKIPKGTYTACFQSFLVNIPLIAS